MTAFDVLEDRLISATGFTPRGRHPSWSFRCPAHGDRSPSLSVKELDDRVLVHCFGGCTLDEVLMAVGLGRRDLFDEPRRGRPDVRHIRMPMAAPLEPGWTHVCEPPDLPDLVRRLAYNASTAEVEVGYHPGGPVAPW